VSFHADGHEPWITAGISSDMNQAALNAIVDGIHYWLLVRQGETGNAGPSGKLPEIELSNLQLG